MIIPYNATVCEREFSEQNRHITKARPNIGTDLLRDLLMICLEGPEFGSAQFINVMERASIVWKLPKPENGLLFNIRAITNMQYLQKNIDVHHLFV